MGRKSEILTVLAFIMVSPWARGADFPSREGRSESLVNEIPASVQADALWQPSDYFAAHDRAADSPYASTSVIQSSWWWQDTSGSHAGSTELFPPPPKAPPQSPSALAASGSPELFQPPPPLPPQGNQQLLIRGGSARDSSEAPAFGTGIPALRQRGLRESFPQAPRPSSVGYDQLSRDAAVAADPQTEYTLSSVNNQHAPSGSPEIFPPPTLSLPDGGNPEWSGAGAIAGDAAGSAVGDVYDPFAPNAAFQVIPEGPTYPWVGPGPPRLAARFGWWGPSSDGDLTKVGEYQSVRASTFLDLDGLWTNGLRTIDFSGTLLGAEESQVGWRFYSPLFSTRFSWQEFPHRLVRDPLSGFTPFDAQPPDPLPPPPNNFRVMKEELDVGEDYAIRVQQIDSSYKGKLANNVNWRLNVWAMRKQGDRQVTAMSHCFTAPNATDSNGNPVTGISCHVLSQGQSIDWMTTEIEPAVEARFGRATVEYARTMRIFSQSDELTTRPYDNFGFAGDLPYAVVPENYTAIDRLRIGLDLPDRSDAYAYLYTGNTLNEFRDTNRRFHGFDLQVTDRSFDGISITGHARQYVQTGQLPTDLLPEETAGSIRAPINYDRRSAGVKGRWRPYHDNYSWLSRFSLSGGYEYVRLDRENALFTEDVLSVDQSSTIGNSIRIRASMRWTPQLDSYVRYRLAFVDDPLFGVPVGNTATNTSLPTQEHLVEIGHTWTPVETFLVSSSIGINNAWHSSDIADFQEDSYPLAFTAWYAPTPRWSISGGLAFFSNWIDQDITLGSKSNPTTLRGDYGGRSDVVNLGTTFARTERLTLSTGYEFVRGRNSFALPGFYADIGPLSDVIVEINRVTAGIDYALRPNIDCYFRYQYFDYQDITLDVTSGTANWFLGGVSAVF